MELLAESKKSLNRGILAQAGKSWASEDLISLNL
jgi:hypothetical protein